MTRIVSKILGVLGIVAAALLAVVGIRRDAKKDRDNETKIKDLENANSIRDRSDGASKRLSEYDDAGYRD